MAIGRTISEQTAGVVQPRFATAGTGCSHSLITVLEKEKSYDKPLIGKRRIIAGPSLYVPTLFLLGRPEVLSVGASTPPVAVFS